MKKIGVFLLAALCSSPLFSQTKLVADNYVLYLLPEKPTGKLDPSLLIGVPDELADDVYLLNNISNGMNAFLLQTDGYNILFDTGVGLKLTENLGQLDIVPEDIHYIFITHMHWDHVGGLTSSDGQPVFPLAKLYVPEPEFRYWKEQEMTGNENAGKVVVPVEAYMERLTLFQPNEDFEDAEDLIPGIRPLAAYGHTPGHTIYEVGADPKVLVWGDITHGLEVQLPYPTIAVKYDVDPDMAVDTRIKVLDYVVKKDMVVAGMHIGYQGITKIYAGEAGGYKGKSRTVDF